MTEEGKTAQVLKNKKKDAFLVQFFGEGETLYVIPEISDHDDKKIIYLMTTTHKYLIYIYT